MKRIAFGAIFLLAFLSGPAPGRAQQSSSLLRPFFFSAPEPLVEPAEGGGGGGQVEPSGYGERYLTRASISGEVSLLGTGAGMATNLPYRLEARLFGNYTNFDWKTNHQNGFYVVVNIGMANIGAMGDWYPWKSLRLSPGVLFFNQNRVRGDFQAQPGSTFEINNVTYASQDSNPVRGTGRLTLNGTGFIATTGWGHYVSRSGKHWSFPFELGAAFINTPVVTFGLSGNVCDATGHNCQPAATFPGLQSNIDTQLASWNHRVSPFHVYPVVGGGATYTFRYRR